MKAFASVLISAILATSVSAGDTLGFVSSQADFIIQNGEVTKTVFDKSVLTTGDKVSTTENHVQFFAGDSNTQVLIGQNASLSAISENEFLLSKGSVVVSGEQFSLKTENGPAINSNDKSTLASVHLFRENEIAVQVIEGNITIAQVDGSPLATVSEEQGVVLTKSENSLWTIKPDQTGAPAFFPILAQVDDEGGSAVEEDEEDRRRFFLLTPLFIVGAATTAAVAGGVVVVDQVNDDDSKDEENDDEFESPIFNTNTVFTNQ